MPQRISYTKEEWIEIVYTSMKDGYFVVKNKDRIICANIKCDVCKYESKCPELGVGSSYYISVFTHKEASIEIYPESFI